MRPRLLALVPLLSVLCAACDQGPPAGGGGGGGGGGGVFAEERRVVGGGGRGSSPAPEGVDVVNRLPFAFVRGNAGNLDVEIEHARTWIVRGEARVPASALADGGVDRVRRVEDIRVSPDVVILFLDVSPGSRYRGAVSHSPAAPTLVDAQGERYLPVGWASLDAAWGHVRYEPGEPVELARDLPPASGQGARLWLIYRVTFGRSIRYVASGNTAVYEFRPPVELNVTQGR